MLLVLCWSVFLYLYPMACSGSACSWMCAISSPYESFKVTEKRRFFPVQHSDRMQHVRGVIFSSI